MRRVTKDIRISHAEPRTFGAEKKKITKILLGDRMKKISFYSFPISATSASPREKKAGRAGILNRNPVFLFSILKTSSPCSL
jgi:hypothetical protein